MRRAVKAGLNRWQGKLPEPRQPREGTSRKSSDPALAYLADLANTPLGREWLRENPFEGGQQLSRQSQGGQRAAGIIAPLPRRKLVEVAPTGQAMPPQVKSLIQPASLPYSLWRLLLWIWGLSQFLAGNFVDLLLRRRSARRSAARARGIMERLGTTFLKLGQQLSVRVDRVPYEYCEEFSKMLDRVPAFPVQHAIAAIERTAGKPLSEIFEVFDPTPVGSASIACVYQAVLHGGKRVAVKVKRPKIAQRVSADMRAMGWLFSLSEMMGVIRPGQADLLVQDVSTMLFDEMDFEMEARNTMLFERDADKYLRSDVLYVPKVYPELSGTDVLVTEFINGVSMVELLGAVDRNDEKALAQMHALGIDRQRVSQNMFRVMNWQGGESAVYHADPHPANMFVLPGGALALIDFGCCGSASPKTQRQFMRLQAAVAEQDATAMVEASVAWLEPLPPIDVELFCKELELQYREWLLDNRNRHSQWWQKSTAQAWLRFLGLSRKYRLNVSLDTVRLIRINLMYDSIAFRLWPTVSMKKEMARGMKRAGANSRRRIRRWFRQRLKKGLTDTDYLTLEELTGTVKRTLATFQRGLDAPVRQFGREVSKASYVGSLLLQLVSGGLVLFLLGRFVGPFYQKWVGAPPPWADINLRDNAFLQNALIVIGLWLIFKIRKRFNDVDTSS